MERTSGRKPIGNFFIKKGLQVGITLRIIAAVVVATILSSATIVLTYYVRHRSVLFYQLEKSGDLSKESIYHIIFPSLVISTVVGVFVAGVIGLYASRKFAVPVYKLEQWAQLLRDGRFGARLRFREQKQMEHLCKHFNELTEELRIKLAECRTLVGTLKSGAKVDSETLSGLQKSLDAMELSESPPENTKA